MKKYTLNWWCNRAWIKFECIIAFITMAVLLYNWNRWGTDLKVVAAIVVLIPLHVLEEWVFPGGFHYQYNVILYKSEKANHYPMCRLSDMFTNTLATFLYVVLTIIIVLNDGYVNTGILMGTTIFSVMEVLIHTIMGIKMYQYFKAKGKTTIYGPGSITAYFGFIPIGVLSLYCINGKTIVLSDWIVCFGILFFIVIICILIPENIIKKKNTPYYFESAGYYENFLQS